MDKLIEILEIVRDHPTGTTSAIAEYMCISRQAALSKVKKLVSDGVVKATGSGKGTRYEVVDIQNHLVLGVDDNLDEFVVWSKHIYPLLYKGIKKNVVDILSYGFTEMLNNVKDHSDGSECVVTISVNPLRTKIRILDNGVGIFEKIKKAFNLQNVEESIFELSKGKLTTDANNHTGEGVFFSSKVFDRFALISKGWAFTHSHGSDIHVMQETDYLDGTLVVMEIANNSTKELTEVFEQFTSGLNFSKTLVPVKLAQIEGFTLMSRSQAKRLVTRFEKFSDVLLDFKDVQIVGQGFADQLFRVFKNEHPNVNLIPINMSEDVEFMVRHVGGI